MCPQNEDVWLEAARLHPIEKSKAILARGVANNPTSVKLWMQASKLEHVHPRNLFENEFPS